MDYNVVVNHVDQLIQQIIEIIINKFTLIKFIMKMMLKHALIVSNKNYILNFINVLQNH